MFFSNSISAILAALSVSFFSGCHSISYSDLEDLAVDCPERDRCDSNRNDLTYMDRSCECDQSCTAYNDCCIDALPNTTVRDPKPLHRTDVDCMHYGEDRHTGVYAISKCNSNWNGPTEVRERCHGPDNFKDPLTAIPVTDVLRNKTYRNLACAECNNANLAPLKFFLLKLVCKGVSGLTEDKVMSGLTYNKELGLWGISRSNRFGNGTEFAKCVIVFEVPVYLNNNVRFCRSNLISNCAADWKRPAVAQLCALYMTAVYSSTTGYRNPHCAICNHKSVHEISCYAEQLARGEVSFAILMDYNAQGGNSVGMGECPSGYIHDPFANTCREIVCALPGYVLIGERCVQV